MISHHTIGKTQTEHSQQTAVFIWASYPEIRLQYPCVEWMYAVPNGGLRNKKTAADLKAEGAKRGVPDFILPFVKLPYYALYVEMKLEKFRNRKNGGCSDEQLAYIAYLRSQNYYCHVAYNYQEAIDVVLWYLNF